MTGLKGTVYFKITRANGEVVNFSIDNTIEDAVLEALRDRVKSTGTFNANYVPGQVVVTLSGSGGARTISGSSLTPNFVACADSGTSYLNYVEYKNAGGGLTFSGAGGSDTVASVVLMNGGGSTIIASATNDATGFSGDISSTFSSADTLDINYKIQFTHDNIAAHNVALQTYRDKVLSNFVFGGADHNIALVRSQLTVGADPKQTVTGISLDSAGSGIGATKAINFSGVASASAPDQFRMLNSDGVAGHIQAIATSEYTASSFTSDDNVAVTFSYTLSKSSG